MMKIERQHRRFKLLKDLPDCMAGEIGEENDGGIVWKTFTAKSDGSRTRYISYPVQFVLKRTNWFEEVKEHCTDDPLECPALKKFTQEKEVIKFGECCKICGKELSLHQCDHKPEPMSRERLIKLLESLCSTRHTLSQCPEIADAILAELKQENL